MRPADWRLIETIVGKEAADRLRAARSLAQTRPYRFRRRAMRPQPVTPASRPSRHAERFPA